MPLRFLLDEDVRGLLWDAIQRWNRKSDRAIEAARVGGVPELPLGSDDPAVLRWAMNEGRAVISRDRSTMAGHFLDHLARGDHSAGLFLIRRRCSLQELIEFLALACDEPDDAAWADQITYIP